jgi:hypothetical protein
LRLIALVIFLAAALIFLLLLPLFVLPLLTLTVRALTLAELSLVSFITHIEFSFAHQIYCPIKMQCQMCGCWLEVTISRAARQLLCIYGPILTKTPGSAAAQL